MTNTQVRTPILEGGIQSINFFNGRLLSGEDLSQEQLANLQARHLLGKAIGDGVAYGLEVKESAGISKKEAPVVTVHKGLALNREGNALQLKSDVDVALVPTSQISTGAIKTLFAECQPPQSGPYVIGKGVYLLTIQGISGKEGRAPVSGLGNLDAACNAKYNIEGVQFRLLQISLTPTELDDAAHLRNHLAYRCFGMSDNAMTSFVANPFGPVVDKYGLIDDLRSSCLQDNEVPLALISWTLNNGIEFIDMWSVRRRIATKSADTDWMPLISDRRVSEGEAMFLQFQDQIEEMRLREQNLMSISALSRFDNLPPVGILPIGSPRGGFDYRTFFNDQTHRTPVFIEGGRVRFLVHESFNYPPIDLSSKVLIWLYLIRENSQTIDNALRNPPQLYLIFANGHIPFCGDAHYDVNRWSYGNYV